MKKIFLFLIILSVNPWQEVWAQDYSNQGILNDTVTMDSKNFLLKLEPKLTNRSINEVQFDDNYHATDKLQKYRDVNGKARFYTNAHLTKKLWLNSYVIAERINNNASTQQGSNSYSENTGAYFQELTLSTNQENYSLLAGKFTSNFGTAWRFDRGLWSYSFAKNYQQNEKLGVAGVYRLGNAQKTGQYNFSASAFTNGRKNDAEPGNTNSPKSYTLGLNINFDFGEQEKLSYNFALLNLAVNRKANTSPNNIHNEKGMVAGIRYEYPWRENIAFDFLLEYAGMKNVGGDPTVKQKFLTGNLITKFYRNWNVLLGNSSYKQNATNQNLNEISFGYDFDKTKIFDRINIQSGFKRMYTSSQDSSQTQNSFGILVRYYKYF